MDLQALSHNKGLAQRNVSYVNLSVVKFNTSSGWSEVYVVLTRGKRLVEQENLGSPISSIYNYDNLDITEILLKWCYSSIILTLKKKK